MPGFSVNFTHLTINAQVITFILHNARSWSWVIRGAVASVLFAGEQNWTVTHLRSVKYETSITELLMSLLYNYDNNE